MMPAVDLPVAHIACYASRITHHALRFWHGRRQVTRFDGGLKTGARMAAVAERFIVGLAAAAQRNDFAPAQPERIAGSVFDDDIVAGYAQRAVVIADDDLIVLVAHSCSPCRMLIAA